MKKTIILFAAGVLGSLGLYLYKNKAKKKNAVVDERSLAKKNNDYVVYHDEEELPNPKGELFI